MLKSVYTTSVLQVCVIRDCVTHDVFPSRLGKKMQDWKMFPLLLGYSFSCSLLFVWWHDITKCQMKSNRKQMLMTFEWKKVCCVSVCYLCVLFCREEWDIVNLHSVCVSSCLCSHACILMLMLLARKGVCVFLMLSFSDRLLLAVFLSFLFDSLDYVSLRFFMFLYVAIWCHLHWYIFSEKENILFFYVSECGFLFFSFNCTLDVLLIWAWQTKLGCFPNTAFLAESYKPLFFFVTDIWSLARRRTSSSWSYFIECPKWFWCCYSSCFCVSLEFIEAW